MTLRNLHTHTTFCDGTASPGEMAAAARKAGFSALGFSAHLAWPFASGWHIAPDRIPAYQSGVRALRSQYAGQMEIFCGFEADYLRGTLFPDRRVLAGFAPDFLIGSVHYVPAEKKTPAPLLTVDDKTENVARWLTECFEGNARRAVKAYFRAVREMALTCRFDVIGHADLIKKRNRELAFFRESDSWYRAEIRKTVQAIARSGKTVEINTGGIARGATDSVYPSEEMLRLLYREGVPVTISSDAHEPGAVAAAFDEAVSAAGNAGYRRILHLTEQGWKEFPLR